MKQTRNPEEIEQLRDRILEQALEILIGGGMEALTMRKLASRTGMTAPNLYNYFSGKDEIYITLVIRGFEMLRNELVRARDLHSDPISQARAMIDAYTDFGMGHPRYYDIMFTRSTPKYHDYVGTPFEHLSAIELHISLEIVDLAIEIGAALTGRPPADEAVRRRVVEIWSLLHGMISLHNSGVAAYVTGSTDRAQIDVDRVIRILQD